MYYTVYKISNKIDGKIYIGSHKTRSLDDGYMGSGKYLKYAQEKYGIENFTKEILFIFDAPDLMYAKEAELVTEEFIALENTYNIKLGGNGGFDYLNDNMLNNSNKTEEQLRAGGLATAEKLKTDKIYLESHRIRHSEKFKSLHVAGKMIYDGFRGKSHSASAKAMIGYKNSVHQTGSNNSQFDTMWITNGILNMKVSKDSTLPEGWRAGRVIKAVAGKVATTPVS